MSAQDNATVAMVNVDEVLANVGERFKGVAIAELDLVVATRDNNGGVTTIVQSHKSDGAESGFIADSTAFYDIATAFVSGQIEDVNKVTEALDLLVGKSE